MTDLLRREYRRRLAQLEDRMLELGDRAVGIIGSAARAVADGDHERAQQVGRSAERALRQSRHLRGSVVRLLALEAPVASELRLVSGLLHTNAYLASALRVGADVAGTLAATRGTAVEEPAATQLRDMGSSAQRVLRRALDAFASRDADAAARVDPAAHELRRLGVAATQSLSSAAPARAASAVRLAAVVWSLEQVGKVAADIADQAVFVVTARESKGVPRPSGEHRR